MKTNKYFLLLLCYLVFAVGTLQANAEPSKRALLIGINKYQAGRQYCLKGCETDVALMKKVLLTRYGFKPENIRTLISDSATLENIRKEFKTIIAETNKDDKVVIFYSGHGTRVIDTNGDEDDRYDEALCPSDAAPDGNGNTKNVLTDDEFSDFLKAIPTTDVMVILDCCHSGTATKSFPSQGAIKFMDSGGSDFSNPSEHQEKTLGEKEIKGDSQLSVLSACAAWEKAKESFMETDSGKEPCGIFTKFLYKELDNEKISDNFFRNVKQQVVLECPNQTPQIENQERIIQFFTKLNQNPGINKYSPVDKVNDSPLPSSIIQLKGKSAVLNIGTANGVTVGSIYAVYPGNAVSLEPSQISGEIKIVSADLMNCKAEIINGAAGKGNRVRLVSRQYVNDPVKVLIKEFPEAKKVRNALSGISHIKAETSDSTVTRIIDSSPAGGIFALYAPDGTLLQDFKGDFDSQLNLLRQALDSAYIIERLSKLQTPSSDLKVQIDIPSGKSCFKLNDEMSFSFKANSDCYVTLLHVSSDGKVSILFPNKYYAENKVKSGVTYTIPPYQDGKFLFNYRTGEPTGQEMVKIIATKKAIDPWGLKIDRLAENSYTGIDKDPVLLIDELLLNLSRSLTGKTSDSRGKISLPSDGTWATDETTYIIGK